MLLVIIVKRKYSIIYCLRSGSIQVEPEVGILMEVISWRISLRRWGAREARWGRVAGGEASKNVVLAGGWLHSALARRLRRTHCIAELAPTWGTWGAAFCTPEGSESLAEVGPRERVGVSSGPGGRGCYLARAFLQRRRTCELLQPALTVAGWRGTSSHLRINRTSDCTALGMLLHPSLTH